MEYINIENLEKSVKRFLEMYNTYKEDNTVGIFKDSVKEALVQRFEYCEELFWKVLRRYIINNMGVNVVSAPKIVYRTAAKLEILDSEIWIKFVDVRNIASHTYAEESLDIVLSVVDEFSIYSSQLLQYLRDNIKNEN